MVASKRGNGRLWSISALNWRSFTCPKLPKERNAERMVASKRGNGSGVMDDCAIAFIKQCNWRCDSARWNGAFVAFWKTTYRPTTLLQKIKVAHKCIVGLFVVGQSLPERQNLNGSPSHFVSAVIPFGKRQRHAVRVWIDIWQSENVRTLDSAQQRDYSVFCEYPQRFSVVAARTHVSHLLKRTIDTLPLIGHEIHTPCQSVMVHLRVPM